MNQYVGPGLGVTAITISGAGIFWLNNKINTEVSSVNEKLKEHENYIDVVPKLVTGVKTNHAHIKFLNEKFLNLNKKIKNQNKTIDALQALSLYHRSMISVLHAALTPLLDKSEVFDGKADLVKKLKKVEYYIVKNQKTRQTKKRQKYLSESLSSSNSDSDYDSDSSDEYMGKRNWRPINGRIQKGKKNKRYKKSRNNRTRHQKKKTKKRRSKSNNISSDSSESDSSESDSSESDSSRDIMDLVNGSRSKK